MGRRRAPRPLAFSIEALRDELAPATPLGAVQGVWNEAVGEVIAAEAQPTSERDGVVTVACGSSVWAQELDLMGGEIVARINAGLGHDAVRALRCVATPPPR